MVEAYLPASSDPLPVARNKTQNSDAAANDFAVFVVEDDAGTREALAVLLETEGYAVAAFSCGADFLEALPVEPRGCVVLDIGLPGFSGLDVQRMLAERGSGLPIIFLTGIGDVPKATAGLKAGAVDFLEKPVDSDVLLEAIRRGLDLGAQRDQAKASQHQLEDLHSHLTPREKEILALLARGYSAKQLGKALGISHRTAEIHRARVMEKLGVQTIADLVALAIRIGIR
jgi:FixJ family two-component response regulator